MEVKEIMLSEIDVSEFNTRKDLGAGTEETSIDDLAISIQERGLLSPIMVRVGKGNKYELIVGQRRYLACKKIGYEKIPAIVRDELDDTDATIISLIENVQRADMNPIDKAKAYQIIYERYKDYKIVAKQTGVSISTIRKYLNLLDLSSSLQEKLTTAEGPAGVGALSRLAQTFSPENQESVLKEIGGFRQTIQEEILKRSDGDLNKLSDLSQMALNGAFNVRTCTEGLCFDLPEHFKEQLKKMLKEGQNFTSLIKDLK